jgi:hypothetical protein
MPWLDEIPSAQAQRRAGSRPAPANRLADHIFAAIDRLARPETDRDAQLLAIRLARIALGMPHTDQDALMARVVALPQPLSTKRGLFSALALDGHVLDVNVIMQAIDEWLADPQNDNWHERQETWEIEPWLELLPFTSRPDAVIEGLTNVKAFYGAGWAKRWERVLAAVAAVPGSDGNTLLAQLARTHYDIAGDFQWMKAVLGRNTPTAVLLFVDLVTEGVFGQGPHPFDTWHAGRELVTYGQKFPELNAEFRRRYEALGAGRARDMLEYFFAEVADQADLIAMIHKYAAAGQPFDARMVATVRAVAVRHEPVEDGSAGYYVLPAPVQQVRKALFDLLRAGPQEAALARRCLTEIDVLRDDHGIAASDTRHPDVMSELPWPEEVGRP